MVGSFVFAGERDRRVIVGLGSFGVTAGHVLSPSLSCESVPQEFRHEADIHPNQVGS
jgi:hypothetical protein